MCFLNFLYIKNIDFALSIVLRNIKISLKFTDPIFLWDVYDSK